MRSCFSWFHRGALHPYCAASTIPHPLILEQRLNLMVLGLNAKFVRGTTTYYIPFILLVSFYVAKEPSGLLRHVGLGATGTYITMPLFWGWPCLLWSTKAYLLHTMFFLYISRTDMTFLESKEIQGDIIRFRSKEFPCPCQLCLQLHECFQHFYHHKNIKGVYGFRSLTLC